MGFDGWNSHITQNIPIPGNAAMLANANAKGTSSDPVIDERYIFRCEVKITIKGVGMSEFKFCEDLTTSFFSIYFVVVDM